MYCQFGKLIEEIQRQAQVCETVAKDKNEQFLVGEATERGRNEADAREWAAKAGVWREVEQIVRKMMLPPEALEPAVPNPLEAPNNLVS